MNAFRKLALLMALGLSILSAPMYAFAAELAKPTGEVILSVSGNISVTNAAGKAEFDLDMLKALPATTFQTKTTWTEGKNSFTGISLQALLAAVGAKPSVIKSIALNDYAVDIPAADAVADGPIIAYLMDGQPMPVRDKGPLWIVYPFDSKAEYRTEATYAKSIWQLSRIELN
jgi:hypothetical protein